MVRKLWFSAFGLMAAAALAIGVNMLADRFATSARVDLTEARLYTLSDGTRQVLGGRPHTPRGCTSETSRQ